MDIEQHGGEASWPMIKPLSAIVYPPQVLAEMSWRHVQWERAAWRLLIRGPAGDVVCTVGGYHREALLDGQPVRIGGIGGVMTHPDHRRRGLVRAAMARACEIFAREGRDWALLFCESHNLPVYTRVGWRLFRGAVIVEQPHGPVVFTTMQAMVLPLLRDAPAGGKLDLCGKPW